MTRVIPEATSTTEKTLSTPQRVRQTVGSIEPVSARRVLVVLLASVALLVFTTVILGLAMAYVGKDTAPDALRSAYRFVDFDRERNLPTFFSASMWLLSGILGLRLGFVTLKLLERFYWLTLGILFIGLSADEWFSFHEKLAHITADAIGLDQLRHFAWVLPAAFAILIFVLFIVPFVRIAPQRTVRLLLLGIVLVISGAVGVELLGGHAYDLFTNNSPAYRGLVVLEESLEMIGVITLVYATYSYLTHLRPGPTEQR